MPHITSWVAGQTNQQIKYWNLDNKTNCVTEMKWFPLHSNQDIFVQRDNQYKNIKLKLHKEEYLPTETNSNSSHLQVANLFKQTFTLSKTKPGVATTLSNVIHVQTLFHRDATSSGQSIIFLPVQSNHRCLSSFCRTITVLIQSSTTNYKSLRRSIN